MNMLEGVVEGKRDTRDREVDETHVHLTSEASHILLLPDLRTELLR